MYRTKIYLLGCERTVLKTSGVDTGGVWCSSCGQKNGRGSKVGSKINILNKKKLSAHTNFYNIDKNKFSN